MSNKISPARFTAVLGMLTVLVMAGAMPAAAAIKPSGTTAGGGAEGGGVPLASDGIGQALVVGGVAFFLMVVAAGGVLWFTARNRGQQH
jgi:hypothetical protein